MTLLTFFGCALTAYGPPLAIFFLTVAKDAQLVILMVSSAFFWLISILIASSIWFVSKSKDPITVLYSVLLQELFRWFFFKLLSRAEKGLILASANPTSPFNRSTFAFVSGLGFGFMNGLVTYINPLVSSVGSGVIMCKSCPTLTSFFIGAITTCLSILLHITWMVLAFEGFIYPKRKYYYIIWVVLSHLGASYSTLFNQSEIKFGCVIGILINIAMLGVSIIASVMALKKVNK
ncbi:gamma-secretase subunit Aph-1 [Glomus cerebriforme]|uniref:Gamma-secretase subunit Aph-1 n=1 Tax=Glomus cerebriforme TaxID=658196 RepID=A0A397T4L7_9GLOM|nr:gamma-secretase subunit Aph-1 [Glomus cerebriforme]